MKLKKIAIAALAAITMATGATGITASAAYGKVEAYISSGTLTNTSGATRYGNVNFIVINRETGSQVTSAGNSGNVANYAALTASKSGYSAISYRFKANGTLYKSTSQYSGVLWHGYDEY